MSLKIEIGDPVKTPVVPNTFEFEIDVVHGDADGYTSFTVGPFRSEDEWAMESLLRTLTAMHEKFKRTGRGGGEEYSYSHVPGFDDWFGADLGVGEEDSEGRKASALVNYPSWPYDISVAGYFDLHGESCYKSHRVFYHDGDSIKRHVSVELG